MLLLELYEKDFDVIVAKYPFWKMWVSSKNRKCNFRLIYNREEKEELIKIYPYLPIDNPCSIKEAVRIIFKALDAGGEIEKLEWKDS